jgi:hypothetical protein
MVLSTAADWGNAPLEPPSRPLIPVVGAESRLPAVPGKVSEYMRVWAPEDKQDKARQAVTVQGMRLNETVFMVFGVSVCCFNR